MLQLKKPLTITEGKSLLSAATIFTEGSSSESRCEEARYDVHLSRERKWHTISAVDHVHDESLPISKKITTLLRHSPTLREPDGAIHWLMIMEYF